MWMLALALLIWPGAEASAQPAGGLQLPIDCQPGVDCWPLRYVDLDPGSGVRDYACGAQTEDGHKGIDIAIRDQAAMVTGVEVRAAAAGVVGALRDGMADEILVDPAAVAGKECGNGIRLDHGDGWTTWYCHLRRGSVMVAEGDRVAAGQALALVGLSGQTSFPHLHFDLRRDGHPVDPFVGTAGGPSCGSGAEPFWRADVLAQLAYRPATLVHAGIAPTPPQLEDARRGYYDRDALAVTSRVLELWVEGYWVQAGDRVRFTILGPDDAPVVESSAVLDKGWQHWFRYVGARRPGAAWPAGRYTGTVTLERAGIEPVNIERVVELR
jgi:hypothetical protein